ncbi:MAG TPA: DUF4446 family protein [Candidatus Paceibacterota bacterium]
MVSAKLLPYVVYSLSGIVTALIIWIIFLEIRIKKLLGGKGKNLEQSLLDFHKELGAYREFRGDIETYLIKVEKRMAKSLRGLGTVRFNALHGTGHGGVQSFATCYLNEKGDGIVVLALAVRDRTSFFTKSIKDFTSEFELTVEEKQAVAKARQSLAL